MTQRQNTFSSSDQNGVSEQPHHSSVNSDCHSLEVSQSHNIAPQELVVESLPNHLIVIHTTPQPVQVMERADSLQVKELAKPGDVNLLSAGSMSSCRWDKAISFISLNVSPTLIEQVSMQTNGSSGAIELIHTFHARDAKILQISQWLLDERHNSGAGRKLYIDPLSL